MPHVTRYTEAPLRTLRCALLDLLSSWWRVDRIRVSPREGELLRLEPGSVIAVKGVGVEIRTKRSTGSGVTYDCQTDDGPAQLEVGLSDDAFRYNIFWSAAGLSQALAVHEIEVFG